MTHEAKPFPIADATNATLYLLTGTRESHLSISVSLREMQMIPGCQVTGVTKRSEVNLESLLTNARGLALNYLSLLIDQFQGTESFLPRLISFTERARELLAKEDMDVLKQIASEELTRTLDMADELPLSAEEEEYTEQLLSRFRAQTGKGGAE